MTGGLAPAIAQARCSSPAFHPARAGLRSATNATKVLYFHNYSFPQRTSAKPPFPLRYNSKDCPGQNYARDIEGSHYLTDSVSTFPCFSHLAKAMEHHDAMCFLRNELFKIAGVWGERKAIS